MKTRRPAERRGHLDHGWLKTWHTFSFGEYRDPQHMGFRTLRVINEDIVEPGKGFGMHPHRDMEIITYLVQGAIEHQDSMGNTEILRAGEVQRMSAGSGIMHSERNPSPDEPLHLLQIWILPHGTGVEPSYEQKAFSTEAKRGRFLPLVTPDGRDGSLSMGQDAAMHAAVLGPGESLVQDLAPGRHAWLQVVRGEIIVGDESLAAGDGLAVSEETKLEIKARSEAEVLLFDLA